MRRLTASLLLAAGILAPPPAHALKTLIIIQNNGVSNAEERFVSASPYDEEHLDEPPDAVTITFTIGVRADRSYIKVYDLYGQQINDGTVTVKDAAMSAALPKLRPGPYRVKWKAECACPAETELDDSYRFTVR